MMRRITPLLVLLVLLAALALRADDGTTQVIGTPGRSTDCPGTTIDSAVFEDGSAICYYADGAPLVYDQDTHTWRHPL